MMIMMMVMMIIIIINDRFKTRTNDISTMNSNNRIAVKLYSLGTQFVSGI